MKKNISSGSYSAKAAGRRNQIIEAAADCFRRSGFQGASMADISGAARMSTGHIYYYFSSKEEIVEAVIDRTTHGVQSILDEIVRTAFGISRDRDTRIDICDPSLVLAAFTEALYNPIVNALFLEYESRNLAALKSLQQDKKACGQFVPGMNLVTVSTMLTSLSYGLIIQAALNPCSDITDLRDTIGAFLKTFVVTSTNQAKE